MQELSYCRNLVGRRDPYISMKYAEIVRVVSISELVESGHYADMAELSVMFNHDVVEMDNPAKGDQRIWRWKPNAFANWIKNHGSLSLNTLAEDLQRGAFSMEEWMKFYMQIGYSLCGFAEVFGQQEAREYGLPGAKKRSPNDDPNQYVETVIEYMLRKHAGKVLKL